MIDKAGGEIIHEFGVGGLVAAVAKIAGSSDQIGSEIRTPYPVHDHAGSQRRSVRNDRFGEIKPARRSLAESLIRILRENRQEAARNGVAGRSTTGSPEVDAEIARLTGVNVFERI